MKQHAQKLLSRYLSIVESFEQNNDDTVPFCAAEPIVSEFTKVPLASAFSDRYVKSGVRGFDSEKDFIGTEFLFPLYEIITGACELLYGSTYADPRPLSGMNAALTVLMTLTEIGDRVLLLSPDAGGHDSFLAVCNRLGLEFEDVPFDLNKMCYKVDQLNRLLATESYSALIIAPSDLIAPPPIGEMVIPEQTRVIYDCTQSFGLIAAGLHENPLAGPHDTVLLGGTHKTLPGPTCGLVMTNNPDTAELLENTITPSFVRNPHPHHVASLALTLIEFLDQGYEYMRTVVDNANHFAEYLETLGFNVRALPAGSPRIYTLTHQVFLSMTPEEAENLHSKCRSLNVSMDQKDKQMYGAAGIRLGVQAVTRLGWEDGELREFAEILWALMNDDDHTDIEPRLDRLRGKDRCLYAINVSAHESLIAV